MTDTSLKGKLTSHTGEFMTVLLLLQPLLDVLSYFMQNGGTTAVTTALRTVLLFVVSLYGFAISDRKRVYAVFYSVIGGFWILHMLSCLRSGYSQPVADAAEYLKLVQFPLWTLAFVTFFKKRENLDVTVIGVLAADFAIILLVIGLSYLVGQPVYTYDYPERNMQIGVLGWFGVANSQSAILSLLVPPLLLWGFRSKRLWLFCVCSVLGFGLLYLTGTRLTFYAALLVSAAFLVLILLERKQYLFCLPLLAAFVLLLVFRGASPMAERQQRSAESNAIFQEKADAIMGEDKDFVYRKGEEFPEEIREKIKSVYRDVYGQPGLYGTMLLADLIDRFGLDAVMEQYEYTTKPEILYNSRTKKLTALQMIWEEKDLLTKLVGFEYAEVTIGGNIYDPENDFPALLYYTGYLGVAMYVCFAAYFVLSALLAFLKDWRSFLTAEFGTAAMMFALALGAAQFSGQVLRKPSVTVYFSVAAALLYCQVHPAEHASLLRNRYDRSSVVFIKHI